MFRIALNFEGGDRRVVESRGDDTVYQAAAVAGVPILTDCLEGACATCKARCVSGEYDLLDPSFDALSSEEEAGGQVLLCQMQAKSDCVIEMPYSLALAGDLPPEDHLGVLQCVEHISSQVYRVGVSLPPDKELRFVAGQYAQIAVPGRDAARAYSFATSPSEPVHLEFFVRYIEGGVMSEFLADAPEIGSSISVRGPLGHFYLRPGTGPIVMIAGGTGLAPMLSMARALREAEQSAADSHSKGRAIRPIHIVHGVREPSEAFGRAILESLPSVTVSYAAERAEPGFDGTIGIVTAVLDASYFEDESTDVYLCGPPPMVSAVEKWLATTSVPDARIFTERFNPA